MIIVMGHYCNTENLKNVFIDVLTNFENEPSVVDGFFHTILIVQQHLPSIE